MIRGEDEPMYLPAQGERSYHAIFFAHGYFSSALHECSHWLIAGDVRRQMVDFGYWYVPDGRNTEQQALFQKVEVKPQAMEWLLSRAANYRFRISNDNLNGTPSDTDAFKQAVYEQVQRYCQTGLSARAKSFHDAICDFYGQPKKLDPSYFQLEDL